MLGQYGKMEDKGYCAGDIMNGKLIVLEGIDGSGKATQSGILEDNLIKRGKDVMHISFPDYGSPSSALVKMYLNGDFGRTPEDVNPMRRLCSMRWIVLPRFEQSGNLSMKAGES